jgi:hypothetical protein
MGLYNSIATLACVHTKYTHIKHPKLVAMLHSTCDICFPPSSSCAWIYAHPLGTHSHVFSLLISRTSGLCVCVTPFSPMALSLIYAHTPFHPPQNHPPPAHAHTKASPRTSPSPKSCYPKKLSAFSVFPPPVHSYLLSPSSCSCYLS